jgi:hypothetical protein
MPLNGLPAEAGYVWDSSCLYSTVRNISGETKKFPALPPHGVELAANEELTVFGNILEAVNRGDRSGRKHMDSFEAAVQNGLLEIRSTPAPILTDEVTDDIQMIVLQSGSLAVANPCWESSVAV